MSETKQLKEHSINKDIFIIFGVFIISLISVFGIYNTFGFGDIYHVILNIEKDTDRYANIAIGVIFGLTMIVLQGVNFKKKDLLGKAGFLFTIGVLIASIVAIIFFFTTSITYPLFTMFVIGISIYMFDLVFLTLGVKGFFFFLSIFSIITVGIYKGLHSLGYDSSTLIVFIAELLVSLILFFSATYPRIKQVVLKIGTRDNIDISNTGSADNSDYEDDND